MNDGSSAAALPERPALHPWCRLVRDEGRYLLEHGGTVVTLEGRAAEALLPKLLPLLDGTRTVDDLLTELGRPIRPAIEQALSLLVSQRLLVEGVGREVVANGTTAAAAFAAAVTGRTSEGAAARALTEASVAVLGSGAGAAEVGRQLEHMGIERVDVLGMDDEPAEGSFVVAVPANGEIPKLARLNERALERRLAWLTLLPFDGRVVIAGPLYLPGESACHACYVLRRGACSGYEEDFDLLERESLRVTSPAPLTTIGAGLAAVLSLRWITTADPTLPGRFYALESGSILRLSHEQLLRVPRCPACGPVSRAVPSPWFEERV